MSSTSSVGSASRRPTTDSSVDRPGLSATASFSAITESISSRSKTSARPISQAPPGKASRSSSAAATASRVFPEPPGPTTVREPHAVGELLGHRRQLLVAADQRRLEDRDVRRPDRQRPRRRKLVGGAAVHDEMKEPLALREVLQAVHSEILCRVALAGRRVCCVAEYHLPAACARRDACGAVNLDPHVPGRRAADIPRVQSHPYAHRPSGPALFG